MAGKEEQEILLIQVINEAVKKSEKNAISIKFSNGFRLNHITNASKKERIAWYRHEPYTDVVLLSNTGKTYNLSLKDIGGAPSMAGGGIAGMEMVATGLVGTFCKRLRDKYIEMGYKKGDEIPEGGAKIPDFRKNKLVTGTTSIGGPISHMYIGPKIVLSTSMGDVLSLNGDMYSASNYASSHTFYIRSRKRRAELLFDPDKKDGRGYYSIYDKINRRLVINDEPPASTSIMVHL